MSSITGYTNADGIDLSYIFHSVSNRIFSNPIVTSMGIIGPGNITYNSNMIGYITRIDVATLSQSISSGVIKSLVSFSLAPGMYICVVYGYNTYSSATGTLTDFYLGLSSNSTNTSSDGFWINISQTKSLPNNSLRFIIGGSASPLQITTTTPFYFIQKITFSGVTVTSTPVSGQSYVKYVKVG